MEAAVKLDHVVLAVDGEHDVNAMVEIVAPELERADAREPLRLALVVDRSGSMAGRSSRSRRGARRGSSRGSIRVTSSRS